MTVVAMVMLMLVMTLMVMMVMPGREAWSAHAPHSALGLGWVLAHGNEY